MKAWITFVMLVAVVLGYLFYVSHHVEFDRVKPVLVTPKSSPAASPTPAKPASHDKEADGL